MILGLSTRWNAYRHTSGEAMVDEVLDLGLNHVELGYDLSASLVPGVLERVSQRRVRVVSCHAFCPVPVIAGSGHPELYTLAHKDRRVRDSAVTYLGATVRFAAEAGASTVVVHGGYVDMPHRTPDLIRLCEAGEQFSPAYDRLKMRVLEMRDRRAARHLQYLEEGLGELRPVLEATGVALALENLPSWESVPSESEMASLLDRLGSPLLRYWHDVGHAQIRQNLGFVSHFRWLERLRPHLAGMHLHDVVRPASDHLMPPAGHVDFPAMRRLLKPEAPVILEPAPGLPAELIRGAVDYLRRVWEIPAPEAGPPAPGSA